MVSRTSVLRSGRRWCWPGVLLVLLITQPGCIFDKWLHEEPPCVLPAQPTKDDLVRHINERSVRLVSWRSNDVRVVTRMGRSLPVKLSAFLAVESPRNFRLAASSLLGYEADFGSNSERFWFWMRRSVQKNIFYARHEDLAAVQRRMPIPFQPDWLVETLIIAPLDGRQVRLVSDGPPAPVAHLVVDLFSPGGQSLQRHIWIDTCTGDIVKQELRPAGGRLIARAEFGDYREDPVSQVRMPHRIELSWPFQKVTMTLHLGHVEVNPAEFSAKTWQFPAYEGYAPFDLARDFMGDSPRRSLPAKRLVPPVGFPGPRSSPAIPSAADRPNEGERPVFQEESTRHPSGSIPPKANVSAVWETAPRNQPAGHVKLPAEPPPFPDASSSGPFPAGNRFSAVRGRRFSDPPVSRAAVPDSDRPPFADD